MTRVRSRNSLARFARSLARLPGDARGGEPHPSQRQQRGLHREGVHARRGVGAGGGECEAGWLAGWLSFVCSCRREDMYICMLLVRLYIYFYNNKK